MIKKLKTKKLAKNIVVTCLLISLWAFAVTADYSSLAKTTGQTLTAANWTQLVNNVKWLITDSNGDVIVNQNLEVKSWIVEALAFKWDWSLLTGLDSLIWATGATWEQWIQGLQWATWSVWPQWEQGLQWFTGATWPAWTTSWTDWDWIVSTDGKVWIWTTEAEWFLHINTLWTEENLLLSRNWITNKFQLRVSNNWTKDNLLITNDNNDNNWISIDQDWNVWIWTTDPNDKLEIKWENAWARIVWLPNWVASLKLLEDNTPSGFTFDYSWTDNQLYLKWLTNWVETNVMSFQRSTWNVWIWTTNPDAKLEVWVVQVKDWEWHVDEEKLLKLMPQNETDEGWHLSFKWAWNYQDWAIDTYNWDIRIFEPRQSRIDETKVLWEVKIVSKWLSVSLDIEANDIKTTSPWYDLLLPTWYTNYDAKCRKVNWWIEFRWRLVKTLSAGWPADNTSVFLPTECRPSTTRYTQTPCHAVSSPRNSVCNLDYYTDWRIGIYTDFAINQIRFEWVRIWWE